MIARIPFPRYLFRDQVYICSKCRHQGVPRCFSTTSSLQSGHNRWSKIKHDKAKADAAVNKHRTVLARDISFASQMFGPDPAANPRLALAIAKAKQAGFPKASIEAAIARGQGVSATGAKLESLTVEAMIPPSVAAVIDIQTDSKLRTLADVRLIIKEHGGQVTPTAYLFERKGRLIFRPKEGVSLDDLLEPALEAGALDTAEREEGKFEVYTEPTATKSVADFLTKALGLEAEASDIIHVATQKVSPTSADDENLASLMDKLKDVPGVQGVYTNAD